MAERGYLMDRQKMAQDIIKDLIPITEGLQEINRNLEAKKEPSRPKIGSKRRFVSDCGPLADTFLRKYVDDIVDKTFGIRYESG